MTCLVTCDYIKARCDAFDPRAHDWIVAHLDYDPE